MNAGDVATEALGLPVRVVVDNDANLGRWPNGGGARASDTRRRIPEALRRVGAGLIIGGHLYGGVAGTAGEIGHTTPRRVRRTVPMRQPRLSGDRRRRGG